MTRAVTCLRYHGHVQKAERLVAITLLLQSRGKMTAQRLADVLGVSVRTIYRDVDSLSLAHIPISMDLGPGGGYFLPDDYRLDPSTFTADEAVALTLGGSAAAALSGGQDGVRGALVKLEAALPEEYRADVRVARERFLFDSVAWYRRLTPTPHLDTVSWAVRAARQLSILYPRSDGSGPGWRRVEPFGLVCKASTWYLVAFCRLRGDFRTFRLDRIRALEIQEEEVVARDFDLQKYWEERRRQFEEVSLPFALTLLVSAEVLKMVGDDCVLLRREEDGSCLIQVHLSSEREAISYALSLGPDAVVVDPPGARDGVGRAARAIADRYRR